MKKPRGRQVLLQLLKTRDCTGKSFQTSLISVRFMVVNRFNFRISQLQLGSVDF